MTEKKPMRAELVDDYRIKCQLLLEEVIDAEEAAKLAAAEIAELRAERDRLKAALVEVEDRLNCRGYPDVAHYCPNCDNSLHNAREIARKALGGDAS